MIDFTSNPFILCFFTPLQKNKNLQLCYSRLPGGSTVGYVMRDNNYAVN